MKRYGFTRSPYTLKVRIVLEGKNTPCDWIEYNNRPGDPEVYGYVWGACDSSG